MLTLAVALAACGCLVIGVRRLTGARRRHVAQRYDIAWQQRQAERRVRAATQAALVAMVAAVLEEQSRR